MSRAWELTNEELLAVVRDGALAAREMAERHRTVDRQAEAERLHAVAAELEMGARMYELDMLSLGARPKT